MACIRVEQLDGRPLRASAPCGKWPDPKRADQAGRSGECSRAHPSLSTPQVAGLAATRNHLNSPAACCGRALAVNFRPMRTEVRRVRSPCIAYAPCSASQLRSLVPVSEERCKRWPPWTTALGDSRGSSCILHQVSVLLMCRGPQALRSACLQAGRLVRSSVKISLKWR